MIYPSRPPIDTQPSGAIQSASLRKLALKNKTDISKMAAEMREQALVRLHGTIEDIPQPSIVEAQKDSVFANDHAKPNSLATQYAYTIRDTPEVHILGFVITRAAFTAFCFVVSMAMPVIFVEIFGLKLQQLQSLKSVVVLGVAILLAELLLHASFASLANSQIHRVTNSSKKEYIGSAVRKISIVLIYLADFMFASIFGLGVFLLAYSK
jgi:hypothetical protein